MSQRKQALYRTLQWRRQSRGSRA